MTETTYKTGQAAQFLGTSSYHIRKLAEHGLIDAEFTPSRQWRISSKELDRLRQEGLPPIPSNPVKIIQSEMNPNQARDRDRDRQLRRRPPGDDDEGSFEEDDPPPALPPEPAVSLKVQNMRDDLTIAQLHHAKRKVEFEAEEVEDMFRSREQQRIAELQTEERNRQAEQIAAGREREERKRLQEKESWIDAWLTQAGYLIPADCPPDLRLTALGQVRAELRRCQVTQSEAVVHQLLTAIIADCLKPYTKANEVKRAIAEALNSLPYGARSLSSFLAPSAWELRARKAAAQAIDNCGDHFTYRDQVAAAVLAIQPIVSEFAHKTEKTRLIDQITYRNFEWTAAQREKATELVKEALEDIPPGAPIEKLQKAVEEALRPLEQKLERRRTAEQIADDNLFRVGQYLTDNCEPFESFSEEVESIAKYKTDLRKELVIQLASGDLAADDVPDWIEGWMDDNTEDD